MRFPPGYRLFSILCSLQNLSYNQKPNRKPNPGKCQHLTIPCNKAPPERSPWDAKRVENGVGFRVQWSAIFTLFSKTQQKTRQSRKTRINTQFTTWQVIHAKIVTKIGYLVKLSGNDTHAIWNCSRIQTFLTFLSITPSADFRIYFESLQFQNPRASALGFFISFTTVGAVWYHGL